MFFVEKGTDEVLSIQYAIDSFVDMSFTHSHRCLRPTAMIVPRVLTFVQYDKVQPPAVLLFALRETQFYSSKSLHFTVQYFVLCTVTNRDLIHDVLRPQYKGCINMVQYYYTVHILIIRTLTVNTYGVLDLITVLYLLILAGQGFLCGWLEQSG